MNDTDAMHVHQLPNEVLSMVFAYLQPTELASSVCPVCQRWNDVAILFMKRLKFGPQGSKQDVINVVEKATLLESIEIHNRTDFQAILKEVFKNCRLSDNKLEEMSLRRASYGSSPNDVVDGVMIGCRSRKCCNEINCFLASHEDVFVSATCSENMIQFGRFLKRFQIQNLKIRSNVFFNNIGRKWTCLTHVTIIECYQFKAASLQLMAENCTELTEVILVENIRDGQRLLQDIRRRKSKNAWDEAYQDLFKKRGALLQVLDVDAELILDSTFKYLSKATNLHTLGLESAVNLAKSGIAAISTLCHLKKLEIGCCRGLNNDTIGKLFGTGNLRGLESLSFTFCDNLRDECLDIISRSCPDLERVNFFDCVAVTDLGVELIMKRCTKLRLLNLYGMGSVHHSCLRLIPAFTPHLECLVVHKYCPADSKRCIEELMARCPNLTIKPDGPVVLAVRCW